MNSSPTYQNTMESEDPLTPAKGSPTTIVWVSTSPRSTPSRPLTHPITIATGDTEDIDLFLHNNHEVLGMIIDTERIESGGVFAECGLELFDH
jgi:hypothetical protein